MLLIEAGGSDNYLWIHIPVGYLYCIGNPRTDWLYATEPEAGLNGRSLRYPRGKVLGGCSSINGMIYMRGQARDYDGWGAGDGHGANPGWSWAECLPYFLQHEDFHKGADAFHAAPGFDPTGKRPGGEWRVEKQRLHWAILDAFAAAARAGRHPAHATTSTAATTKASATSTSTSAPASAGTRPRRSCGRRSPRPNLQVWTGAHIHRVAFDGRRARCGVEVAAARRRRAGDRRASSPGGEVVLAAGAIGTPQILQLSGIGDPTLLAAHGIAVRARAARRRREPAGPPADPRRLRRRGREDAQHDAPTSLGQGA